jgi:tRNA threonylcarbamoyladenosine biosynthesis protein TsaE
MIECEAVTASAEETQEWGREFAKVLRAPVLVALSGELGSGKTTLTKGIVAGLGAAEEEDVTSPTFTLMHVYGGGSRPQVVHADLYRIEGLPDFETLGMEDLFDKPGIAILEWPERFPVRSAWPVIHVHLEHLGGDRRRIWVEDAQGQSPPSHIGTKKTTK